MWKFYNLSWERLPLEPQQGMGMFSSTSAEKVPDLGSVERTQLQHHQRTQRHCQTHPRAPHSPPTALPEISKWTRTEQHHSTPFLHPKPHTWHFQGNFLRCRAELSALTSWAGFERRFKPAGVELNPDNPCSILFLWQVMLLQVGVQIFRYSDIQCDNSCPQKGICEITREAQPCPSNLCWKWMLSGGKGAFTNRKQLLRAAPSSAGAAAAPTAESKAGAHPEPLNLHAGTKKNVQK